jgi:hypothetical protein
MLTFIQKCGATSETAEDLRDFIMNAKKPSNLRFEDFKRWLEELDDYLPYLPGPLNQRWGDDQLFVTLKKCVPAWQKKYTDSNARKNFLHQYTSPFTTLPSVLFYKEGLYISTQHHSKHCRMAYAIKEACRK